jgi:hypothetical protein
MEDERQMSLSKTAHKLNASTWAKSKPGRSHAGLIVIISVDE